MQAEQLRDFVIRPVLDSMEPYGIRSKLSAERLLLGTAAMESNMGHYLGGGIYQCEPITHLGITSWLYHSEPGIFDVVTAWRGQSQWDHCELCGNLFYATAIARVHYWRVPEPLPEPSDIMGMAQYWKDHYNTHLDKGTVREFLNAYNRYVR